MQEDLIKEMKSKGYLPSPDILRIPALQLSNFIKNIQPAKGFQVLTEDLYKKYSREQDAKQDTDLGDSKIVIIKSFGNDTSESDLKSFVGFYNYRYVKMSDILRKRTELQGAISINHMFDSNIKGEVKLIGMVYDFRYTNNQNLILELEDPTGRVKIIIPASKKELMRKSGEIVKDEVIGISGTRKGQVLFVNDIFFPEIPATFEYKKSGDDVNAVFISDIHCGSTNFLEKPFNNFISWIKGVSGTERQREEAKKVRYLFIAGDLVDGVGIYPGQEEELVIKDINKQYEYITESIKQIPDHINVIICPGNHDAVRLEEPQPVLPKKFFKDIISMKNITFVSNPSIVNIHGINNFSGLNTLMYHGYSFDHYCSENVVIRKNGGYDNITYLMEFLLRKRHLAPSHESSPYISCNTDNMIIDPIPDLFIAGHTHRYATSKYKHMDLISASCFQKTTSFQEKLGHKPNPGIVPVLNLKTRQVRVVDCL